MTYKIAALYKFTPIPNAPSAQDISDVTNTMSVTNAKSAATTPPPQNIPNASSPKNTSNTPNTPDIPTLKSQILNYVKLNSLDSMCGTLLLAPEGINGTIGGYPAELDQMIDFLDQKLGIKAGELKYSESADKPFNRFKIRPKKEIITMRAAQDANPNIHVGEYVSAGDWNNVITDPDVTVIDTRNEYETRLGTFKGAIDPKIDTFTQFCDYVKLLDPNQNKKIAMFCTGGIRCEKASAYMLSKGFETVYHLKGGILKYLEDIPQDQSLWDGDCFVFDNRVAVGHGLSEAPWTICHGCREPLAEADTKRLEYEKGVSCHYCHADLTPARAKALRDRQKHYNTKNTSAA